MSSKDEALKRAIEAVGTGDSLAARIGITPQALSQWNRVPPLRVLDVERVSGVPRHELRPDIYPADDAPIAPASSEPQPARS